jgi:hypothetical protein
MPAASRWNINAGDHTDYVGSPEQHIETEKDIAVQHDIDDVLPSDGG